MTIKFVDFEKTTEGLVKFFRLVKNKVSSLFGHSEEVFDDLDDKEKSIFEILNEAAQELQEDEPMGVAEEDTVEQVTEMKEIKKMTRSEEIRMLVEQHKAETDSRTRKDILQNLVDLKRASKKSWKYHGVSEKDAKRITEIAKIL